MAAGGLFITLYDEKTLELYLSSGLYGFLMNPVFTKQPSSRAMHYAALADYACSREGGHVFFFLKRRIVYGGVIKGNSSIASFYLNGKTSPLGRQAKAELFWDETPRYMQTPKEGVFKREGKEKAQPFIIQFAQTEHTGKEISSDDLYFELGQFPYPLPSNTIQGMSFCTLTPGETEVALGLIERKKLEEKKVNPPSIVAKSDQTLFDSKWLSYDSYINEAHLEFTILADLAPFQKILEAQTYVLCRQVPLCPFKPIQLDRADIALYSLDEPISNGTIPNIIIELKKDKANFHAYNQVVKYLRWVEKIVKNQEDFEKITAFIVAPAFYVAKSKVDLSYENKIKMYDITTHDFYQLFDR